MYGTIETTVEMEVVRKSRPSDDQSLARKVIKNVHDDIALNCGISFDPKLAKETVVQWFRLNLDNKKQLVNFNLLQTSTRSDLKYLKMINNSLLIQDLVVEDEGKYLCLVKTPYESSEFSVELFVHGEPPKILSNLTRMALYEGKNLEIRCLAKGVPLPTLKWFFKNKPLSKSFIKETLTDKPDSMESRILIENVMKINEGTYQCEATNVYGSGTKYATLDVVTETSVQVYNLLYGFYQVPRSLFFFQVKVATLICHLIKI